MESKGVNGALGRAQRQSCEQEHKQAMSNELYFELHMYIYLPEFFNFFDFH